MTISNILDTIPYSSTTSTNSILSGSSKVKVLHISTTISSS